MSRVAFLDVFVPRTETSGLALYYSIAVLMVLFCVHIKKCHIGSLQNCSAEFHEMNLDLGAKMFGTLLVRTSMRPQS